MIELRKDPKGEEIFTKMSMNPTGALDMTVMSTEVDTLRKRIKDLETELVSVVVAKARGIITLRYYSVPPSSGQGGGSSPMNHPLPTVPV